MKKKKFDFAILQLPLGVYLSFGREIAFLNTRFCTGLRGDGKRLLFF